MVSKDEKRWRLAAHIILTIISALAIIPFVLLVIASFTDDATALQYGYRFFPKKMSIDAYAYIISKASVFAKAYGITIIVTIIGTTLSVVVTALTAYVLSKRDFPLAKPLNFLMVFTMLFNGGLVSTYISYTTIFHIKDTLAALIMPNLLMGAFTVMLVRNYFEHSIPEEIYESARIDGASEFKIFGTIVLPLSVPILATVGLMSGLAYWNDWQNSMYYVNDKSLYSIQAILNGINQSISMLSSLGGSTGATAAELPTTTIRMAIAVVGILPILIVYPFFQKYFAKGLVAGAVKG